MTDLDHLPPESRAVVSLVVTQRRSYDEIGRRLRLDPDVVRKRMHTAADQLAANGDPMPDEPTRSRIVDYLLGELTVSERAQIRAVLLASEADLRWAARLSEALAPLSPAPLAALPEPAAERPDAVAQAPPPAAAQAPPPAAAEPPSPAGPRRRRLAPSSVVAGASLAVALVAVIVAVIAISGSSSRHGGSRGPRRAASAPVVDRIALAPAGSQRRALGAGVVVRQRGGLLLLVQGRGLAPNHGDSYAVWLYNDAADARLLGFVSPEVGAAGTFSSGTTLPDDAVRFHHLWITVETDSAPAQPGQPVLRGPLSVP